MVSIFLFYVTSCENVALFQRIYVALFTFCCIIFYDHQKLQFPNREIDGNCRRPNELPRPKTNYDLNELLDEIAAFDCTPRKNFYN